jgi:hypothetical protein
LLRLYQVYPPPLPWTDVMIFWNMYIKIFFIKTWRFWLKTKLFFSPKIAENCDHSIDHSPFSNARDQIGLRHSNVELKHKTKQQQVCSIVRLKKAFCALCNTPSTMPRLGVGLALSVYRARLSLSDSAEWLKNTICLADRCYDFLNIFAEKFSKKLAFLAQNKAKFWKTPFFSAENWGKSQKIVIITSTPGPNLTISEFSIPALHLGGQSLNNKGKIIIVLKIRFMYYWQCFKFYYAGVVTCEDWLQGKATVGWASVDKLTNFSF